jgi:hypothetical protein
LECESLRARVSRLTEQNKDELERIRRRHDADAAAQAAMVKRLLRENTDLAAECRSLKLVVCKRDADSSRLYCEISQLQNENASLHREQIRASEALSCTAMTQTEKVDVGIPLGFAEKASEMHPVRETNDSESRLRAVMTRSDASIEEMREAVLGAEALLAEAKRELASRDLRQRRAAYEALCSAIESQKEDAEDVLAEAISKARQAQVDAVDIEAGEVRLDELRGMSSKERAERALRQKKTKKKELAFLFVKRDDATSLQQLMEELEDGLHWQDWRDHSGRSLLHFATHLGATHAQRCLAGLLDNARNGSRTFGDGAVTKVDIALDVCTPPFPEAGVSCNGNSVLCDDVAAPKRTPTPSDTDGAITCRTGDVAGLVGKSLASSLVPYSSTWPIGHLEPLGDTLLTNEAQHSTPTKRQMDSDTETVSGGSRSGTTTPECHTERSYGESPVVASPCLQDRPPSRSLCTNDNTELRSRAFRATVQNDAQALGQVLESVPMELWSKWQNKAGRDLLTLAEERGSSAAYCILARALGLLQERPQQAFKDRDTVWVLEPGQIQPRRASILGDAPDGDADVLLEYWDGDDEPSRVPRAVVMKSS